MLCTKRALSALVGIAVVALAGCATNTEGPPPPSGAEPVIQTDQALTAKLPADVKASGKLVVGIDPPYTPLEFVQDGKIVGFDVDVLDATAKVLGLRTDYREAPFDKIIPAITANTYTVGNSSFTDTKEREKTIDFVTYFNAGILWAAPTGETVDPNAACGLSVAVKTGSYVDTKQVPALSEDCTKAGKPPINRMQFTSQDSATNAVVLGKAQAMAADSPLTAYAIKQSGDKLAQAGEISEAAPYGWVVAKGSPLGPVLQEALQKLIDDGTYMKICERWGLQTGAITQSKINDARS